MLSLKTVALAAVASGAFAQEHGAPEQVDVDVDGVCPENCIEEDCLMDGETEALPCTCADYCATYTVDAVEVSPAVVLGVLLLMSSIVYFAYKGKRRDSWLTPAMLCCMCGPAALVAYFTATKPAVREDEHPQQIITVVGVPVDPEEGVALMAQQAAPVAVPAGTGKTL